MTEHANVDVEWGGENVYVRTNTDAIQVQAFLTDTDADIMRAQLGWAVGEVRRFRQHLANGGHAALFDGQPKPGNAPAKPRTVCLCGSMRFEAWMREAAREESVAGRMVLMPLCNMKESHPLWADAEVAERIKVELDALHKAKIDAADEVVVVAPGGYIGDSTKSEIAYAEAHGKPVRYWPAEAGGTE